MMTTEFNPVRMELNIDNQLIKEFNANGQIINLQWDYVNKFPYFNFNNLNFPPIILGAASLSKPAGQELYTTFWQIKCDSLKTTQEKYYVNYDGELDAYFSLNTLNVSYTCSNCMLTMKGNDGDHVFYFDFNILSNQKSNGNIYNYITLTGFEESP